MIRLNGANFQMEILEHEALSIVLFEASWSGFCHVIASALESMSRDFGPGVKIATVDLDSNPALANTYGIREVPTILFFQKGRVVDRVTGAISRKTLAEKVQSRSPD